MIDYKSIESKWQKAWLDAKIFESEPNDKEPILITAAFPYVNAPQHIGHLRTYGTTDTYARYKRMKGMNVLYPMAFHATGTPIVAFAKRIANNDTDLIEELRVFHVPDEDIKRMVDPVFMANYFINEIENGMKLAGYSIDWRRKFVSTEPLFSKMVEWQFQKLNDIGYITQGKHPVGWCPMDNNAVGQHDTKHDVQPEIETITVIKFKDTKDEIFFPCATYRPETIYGATNIFVKDDAQYVIAKIGNEKYYISKDAAEVLKYQFKVEVEGEISGKELLNKRAINPINKEEVPVFPGFFVKVDTGTGIVMSVPSHAPFDYVALQRLKANNYPIGNIEYRKLIEIEQQKGMGIGRMLDSDKKKGSVQHQEIPALAYLEILDANPDSADDAIEFATKALYREESHWGKMIVGKYRGMSEPEARDKIKEDLIKNKEAFDMYVLGNEEPVYCRDGTRVVVKVVDDQWFINYGDKKWKKEVKDAFANIAVYPEKLRVTFENVIDWLDLRATERKQGLGTKFPFNKDSIIESLSDSTIYPSFYTFVHIIRANEVDPADLKPAFFDYIFNSVGDPTTVSNKTGMDKLALQKCKESFEYWYGKTSRHSAIDNLSGHMTMYVFNHIALFEKKYWPKQLVVNGLVNYEGEKMSKSLGNIVPLVDGIANGVDPLRFMVVAGAELDTDAEFSIETIKSIKTRNDFLYKTILNLSAMKSRELSHIDYWLYSKLNSKIKNASEDMEKISLKNAYTDIFYNSIAELRWYFERGGTNEMVVREFLENVVLMLAPAMPHIGEEFWHMLDKQTLAAQERWPEANEQMISEKEEFLEELIRKTSDDIGESIELTSKMDANKGKKPHEIKIIIASPWKLAAFNMLAETKGISQVMKNQEFESIKVELLSKYLMQFSKKLQSLIPMQKIESDEIVESFKEAKDYLTGKFNVIVTVESEAGSKSARAFRALPDKPSIDIVWR